MEALITAISNTHAEVQEWRALGDRPCTVGEKAICLDESYINLEDRYRGAIEDLGRTAIGQSAGRPRRRWFPSSGKNVRQISRFRVLRVFRVGRSSQPFIRTIQAMTRRGRSQRRKRKTFA